MARALASAARPAAALSESAHWIERAEGLLAPLLYTANLAERDMETVCRWVLSRDVREPVSVLEGTGHEMAQAVLAGVLATEERERSGIFSTASGLLSAYRSDAALATTKDPNFDPAAFARSTDALYICAPSHAQEQLAPIVVALLEQIRSAVYARPPNAAPVIFALDEVASIAPLASLPAMAAEGGGQGLMTLACLQDLSQARARWGEVADGFFSLFNEKLIFPGIGDQRTLALVSALAGEEQVQTRAVNRPDPLSNLLSGGRHVTSVTTSSTWRPRMPVDQVARGMPGHALSVLGSQMHTVRMVPWFEHRMFATLARLDRPFVSEATRPEHGAGSEATRTRPVPSDSPYDGPTVMRNVSTRYGWLTWIANGSQSPERQFGPPRVRRSFRPKILEAGGIRTDLVDRAIESFRAEALELDVYDPLLDEAPEWEPSEEIDVTSPQNPVRSSSADVDDDPGAGIDGTRQIEVRILGPVEVIGWRAPPERPIVTELVCYLALHRDRPVTGEALRAALRPDLEKEQSADTLRTYLSMLRKSLGPDALPRANRGGYRLADIITTDWDLFNARASASDLESKLDALRLIRGQPFEGVPKGSYVWVFSELLISDIDRILSPHTRDVAQLCWEGGRRQDAIWALRQGLLAARHDFGLWEIYLSLASELGRSTLEHARREARAALGDDAPLGKESP